VTATAPPMFIHSVLIHSVLIHSVLIHCALSIGETPNATIVENLRTRATKVR
jgi:hypothetical protein